MEDKHWWFTGRRRILQDVIHHCVSPSEQVTLLDVGCGTGGNVAAFANVYRCIGIDVSEVAIAMARSRFPDVDFVCGNAPDDIADLMREVRIAMLTDVLEHVPDDYFFLSSLLRSVRAGTYLVLTVPANLDLWSEHDVSLGHYRRYDFQRFQKTWDGLAVTCLGWSYFNSRLYPVVRLIRSFNRQRGRAFGQRGSDLSMPPSLVNTVLHRLLASESRVLIDHFSGKRQHGFRRGVSLMAVLRRDAGEVPVRRRPADAAPDYYDPVNAKYVDVPSSES